MSFLNVALLGGIAALAIPLIIHLLNRSRFKTIEWGAMHLLESVVASNSRRIRIEQLLLLLIRCAIPALLAFCLARPVLTGWQALPGDAPSSTVILLDNSYSMDALGRRGTRLAEATDDAKKIVQSLGKGSDVSLILMGGRPTPLFDTPVFDSEAIVDQLDFPDSGRGATSWPEALELASSTISGMASARRNLIILSDFGKSDMDALNDDQLARFRDNWQGQAASPAITLIQRSGDKTNNVAIEEVKLSASAIGVGQSLKIRVRIKNYGSLDISAARLQLKVDSQLAGVTEVAVSSDATAQALFVHQFDSPGAHVITVEIDAGDDLKTDNRYAQVVDVIDSIEVLLVDGAPSHEPMQSETDFLSVALTPFSLGRMKLADLVETRIVKPDDLDEEQLRWARVVILANVDKLRDDRLSRLREFVDSGGGLITFLGNKINVDWYNRTLYDKARIMPLPIRGSGGSRDDAAAASHIVAQFFDHPSLQLFNSGASELARVEVRQWYILGETDSEDRSNTVKTVSQRERSDSLSDPHSVMMKLDTGDPLLVEKSLGKGLVITCATSADADWTTLPLRPVYLPLIQQLVTSIATPRGVPESNLEAGQTLVAFYPPSAAETTQVLSLPGSKQKPLTPMLEDGRSVIRYADTAQPGVYTLTVPDASPRHFAVETDRAESDIATIDQERLQSFASALGADVVEDADAYLALDASRRHGREIWRWALAALLVFLFAELYFQQRFARVRG